MALSLDNLEAVLVAAEMSLVNLVRLNVYTTNVDLLFAHYGVLASRLGSAGVAPATTMLGVTRLAIPGQWSSLKQPPSTDDLRRPWPPERCVWLPDYVKTQVQGLIYN